MNILSLKHLVFFLIHFLSSEFSLNRFTKRFGRQAKRSSHHLLPHARVARSVSVIPHSCRITGFFFSRLTYSRALFLVSKGLERGISEIPKPNVQPYLTLVLTYDNWPEKITKICYIHPIVFIKVGCSLSIPERIRKERKWKKSKSTDIDG